MKKAVKWLWYGVRLANEGMERVFRVRYTQPVEKLSFSKTIYITKRFWVDILE